MNNNESFTFEEEGVNTPAQKPPTGTAVKAMVFGIIGIELSVIPFVGIVGLIFSILAKKWATPIIEDYPYTSARLFAKAGRITGSVGLGLAIGFTIFWCLYLGLFFMIGLLGGLGLL